MTDADLQRRVNQLEQICGTQQIMLRLLIDAVNNDHVKRLGQKAVSFQFSDSQMRAFREANNFGGIS